MVKDIRQYEVYWISLDPTQGSEMAITRPLKTLNHRGTKTQSYTEKRNPMTLK